MGIDIAKWLSEGALISVNKSDVLMCFGERKKWSEPTEKGYSLYSPGFYLKTEQPWHSYEQNILLNKQSLLQLIRENITQIIPQKLIWSQPDFNEFESVFKAIQQDIQNKKLNKLVPVVFEISRGQIGINELSFYLGQLLKVDCSQHLFGMWSQGEGILGLTPELLFNYNKSDNKIITMALAGTDKVTNGDNSLLNNTKEMQEHGFVVQNIKTNFESLGPVNLSQTYEWSINELKHLRTDIEVELSLPCSINKIISELHPTPALGVHPKSYNWLNIKNFETNINRSKFGAPFGLQDPKGNFKSVVAIRNMQWSDKQIIIGSGCGIVKQSELNKEWQELNLKRSSVKKYLGMV